MSERAFTRVSYLAGASVQYGNTVVSGHTDNLSLNGMHLKVDNDNIPLNIPVDVTVDYRSSHTSFKCNAKVVRKEATGLGLQINKLSADSFVRLRDIIEKNSFDSEKVMSETFSMLKCIY